MRRRTQAANTAEDPQGNPSYPPTKKHQGPRHDYEQVAEGMGRRADEGEITIENQNYGTAAAVKTK